MTTYADKFLSELRAAERKSAWKAKEAFYAARDAEDTRFVEIIKRALREHEFSKIPSIIAECGPSPFQE